jgi:hypothetical protein
LNSAKSKTWNFDKLKSRASSYQQARDLQEQAEKQPEPFSFSRQIEEQQQQRRR